jgi:hypothetical protein
MVGTRTNSKSPPSSPKASLEVNGAAGNVVTPSRKEKNDKAVNKKAGKPKNMIAAGKFSADAGYGQKKDSRSRMYFEFLACGIVVAYVSKANDTEEAFLVHDYKTLGQDNDLRERLKIITICARRGADGNQVPSSDGSSYPFRQFVLGVYPNTHSQAKKQVKDLLDYLNKSQEESGKYKYPKKIRLMEDYSHDSPRAADTRLLDNEVVNMMMACYGSSLEELGEYDEVMSEFWSDIGYGRNFLKEYLNINEGGDDEEDEEENE